jgi:hypothetical protein
MAEKFSVLIKYKYLEYIDNAKLSDADAWVFLRGIIEYDRTGKEPSYKNQVLTGLFAVVKSDLDSNREKWESVSDVRSDAGKKGAQKRWGKRDKAKMANAIDDSKNSKCQKNQKNMAKMHDLDSDSDHDSESDLDHQEKINSESGGGNSSASEKNKTAKPPPPVEQIKKETAAHGFFIDNAIARQFQSGIDPPWLMAPFSFLEFAAARVRKKYPDKDVDALKPIFISAVKSWEDLREAYPAWKAKQEAQTKQTKRDAELKKAMANVPQKCPHCRGKIVSLICQSCGGRLEFDENIPGYKLNPAEDSLAEKFRESIKRLGGANL